MHFCSVLSALLVPIHTHLKTSRLKHSSCSVMITVIQLDSYITVVVEVIQNTLYTTVFWSTASPLAMKTKLHSEKKGNIQNRQMSISSTILFPLGLLRDPPRDSIPCQKLFYPKSDQEKIYISFVFTYYTYIYIFFNNTVAEGKKKSWIEVLLSTVPTVFLPFEKIYRSSSGPLEARYSPRSAGHHP